MTSYSSLGPELKTPKMARGHICRYDPQTELYVVKIGGVGTVRSVRALQYGSNRPYPSGKDVICVRLSTVEWVIMGMIPNFESPPTPAKSPADTIADKDKEFRQAVGDKYQILAASAKKLGTEVHYEGDVVLDNDRGSFIKVMEDGGIWGLASYFCFFLFSALKSLVFIKARDALFDFAGFLFSVGTDTTTKQATTKLDIAGDQSSDAEPDMCVRAGALGALDLFEQVAEKEPSAVSELVLPATNVAGGTGVVSTADILPTESVSTEQSSTSDGRVLWWLFGGHALLEVDNKAAEVRLSRVKTQKNSMTGAVSNAEGDIKQLRLNDKELGLQWKNRWVSLNDTRVSVSFGDNYVSLDDKKASLVFGDNFIVVNKNGVQIKGFLELIGGKIKLVGQEGNAVKPDAGGVVVGSVENVSFDGTRQLLDITGSLTVNKLGLVNEVFLSQYDKDMAIIKLHEHTTTKEGLPTTPIPQVLDKVDQPPTTSSKPVLTSKII